VSVQWPASMRRVFVDTSAYYALTDSRDANHSVAVETARRLARD
jgi:predicted nucleic acid-binding protein